MKKLTCISYHATGSGAVDDYLREFKGFVFAPSGVECRFLQDPDGISDLQYNLVDNPNRLNSGYALKRYMKFAIRHKRTYKKVFGKAWLEQTNKYINDLITQRYKGYWHEDILLMNPIKQYYHLARRAINRLKPAIIKEPTWKNYFPNAEFVHSYVQKDFFIKKTREYINQLCEGCCNDESYFVLDQFVPTSNIERYINYIDDIKVIIVDRDPRDVFIQNVIVNDHVLPKDASIFAKVYSDHRKMASLSYEADNVLRIQFEDLIYRYEETTICIKEFLGLDESMHLSPQKYFKPLQSMKNTRMWVSHPEYLEQAELIAREIPEYIYDYSEI